MRNTLLFPLVLVGAIALAGCGSVKSAPVVAGEVPYAGATTAETPDLKKIKPDSVGETASRGENTERFQKAYSSANSPRFCVLLNQEFSGEITEWTKLTQIDVTGYLKRDTGEMTKGKAAVTAAVSNQDTSPASAALRAHEEILLQEFRSAGVRLVDSRVALRKMAAQRNLKDPTARDTDDYRTLEAASLTESADILIEVIGGSSGGRLIFHAKAVDLRNNAILAGASTLPLVDDTRIPGSDPDAQGGVKIPGSDSKAEEPDARAQLKWLAQELMGQLAAQLR
jgi:hypothetical protein